MTSDIANKDRRGIKTEKALYAAMFSLLRKLSFKKITIKKVCEEASISRAAFYSHFIDKYDLLEYWLAELWPENFNGKDTYEHIEKVVNTHLNENMKVLENLIYDADNETIGILFDFILKAMHPDFEKDNSGDICPKNIVLSSFYAGGMISYLLWQVKNKFPSDVPPMSRDLYEIINELRDWQSK